MLGPAPGEGAPPENGGNDDAKEGFHRCQVITSEFRPSFSLNQ
ncbi:hypothetical protein SynRS9907_01941 [Synechococcus sp. RS9907]|nr:hypothetical protein SynRS9907_01941 [Synechococcus sp. RS9907]